MISFRNIAGPALFFLALAAGFLPLPSTVAAFPTAPDARALARPAPALPDARLNQAAAAEVTATLTLAADPEREGRLRAELFGLAAVPSLPVDAHIAFVLDGSGSMAGTPNAEMAQGAKQMLDLVDLPAHPSTKIGVIYFNSIARVLCQLTNEVGRLQACINKVSANGGTQIDRGIQGGLRVLRDGRSSLPNNHQEILVVLSDGMNNADCPPVLAAADTVKAENIRLFTICAGPDCDRACMRQVATPGDDYEVLEFGRLGEVFSDIGWRSREVPGIDALTLELLLPDGLRLDLASASRAPSRVDADGVAWRVDRLDRDGLAVSLELEVEDDASPASPVTLRVVAETVDGETVSGEARQPVPAEALPPAPTPTAEPSPTPVPWYPAYLPHLRQIGGPR